MGFDWMTLVIKVAGLLSACGGPMLIVDRLKGRLGTTEAFLIAFLPVGLMIFGAFHLTALPGDRWARRSVEVGLVGMLVMVAMQAYGVWRILGGLQSLDLPLYWTGIATGLLSAIVYSVAAARLIARDHNAR